MKKLILVAALALGGLLACSTISMAQDDAAKKDATKGGKNRFSVDQQMERLTTALTLTDDQKPKVKAVLEESSKAMQGLRDLPQDERRTKMQSIRDEQTKKINAILTPEQQEKYTKMQDEMKKKGGQKKKTDQ
jgi:Spy/CpxP family protein refolding chaperone